MLHNLPFRQLNLPVFSVPSDSQEPKTVPKPPNWTTYTTKEVLRLLKIADPVVLYLCRRNGEAYFNGRYLVWADGKKNKWLGFKRI
jgi:hypothetical protein